MPNNTNSSTSPLPDQGDKPNKSSDPKGEGKLQNEQFGSYLAGLIEGDGSIIVP